MRLIQGLFAVRRNVPGSSKLIVRFTRRSPQHLGVEIEIPLWIRSDRRHMTYSGNGFFHLPSSLFRPFDPLPDMRKPSTFWIRLEPVLVEFERLNLRFQRRPRYAQFGRGPC